MAAPPPAKVHVRPYKDYLTPSLHRRFVKASKYTLLLSYAIACWMGVEWDNKLWSFFPLGFTGIRALMIFLSALIIYVLRVAQWHVGRRQTQTPVETFSKYLLRKSTLVTVAFYLFSGWIYSEIYIWSRPASDKLGMIDSGRTYERLKLNERPLYLRYCFGLLALAQSARHLWNDYDAIELPPMAPKKDREDGTYSNHSAKPRVVLMNRLPKLATSAAITAACVTASGIFLYFLGPRSFIWSQYYNFCKYFVSLSKTSKPTGVAPFGPLLIATGVEGTLLCLLWEFVNKAFSLYIAQEPLKHDKPITNDSPDPNGTLLNGLKSKKEEVKAIAFWELALITDAFPERRLTIYKEHDRRPAPTFKQVTTFCLAEIEFMINRINVGLDPAYNIKNTASDAPAPGSLALVPQISKPTQDKPVTAPVSAPKNNWDRFERDSSSFAKSHSSSANVQQAYGREAINKGMKIAQDGAQQAETSINSYYNRLVFSVLGFPFRHSLRRTTGLVVLGAPYSRLSLICNAITALTNLAVFSLKQDELGQFHEGVPAIIRVFTAAITKIDEYMAKVEIHKSDTETLRKPAAEQKKVSEVEEVRECLRLGLEKILGSFNEFLTGLGLSKVEQLDAKKVVGARKGPEMMHVTN